MSDPTWENLWWRVKLLVRIHARAVRRKVRYVLLRRARARRKLRPHPVRGRVVSGAFGETLTPGLQAQIRRQPLLGSALSGNLSAGMNAFQQATARHQSKASSAEQMRNSYLVAQQQQYRNLK